MTPPTQQDTIEIEILPDGTIKVLTDGISQPNHLSADRFLAEMAKLTGGEVKIEKRTGHAHTHSHTHGQKTVTHSH